jgi:hypothetical protein
MLRGGRREDGGDQEEGGEGDERKERRKGKGDGGTKRGSERWVKGGRKERERKMSSR